MELSGRIQGGSGELTLKHMRPVAATDAASIGIIEETSVTKHDGTNLEVIGVAVADGDNLFKADRDEGGGVVADFHGRPSRQEEDTLKAGRVLLEHLADHGVSWCCLQSAPEGTDADLTCKDDEKRLVRIQVTQSLWSPGRWKSLATGSFDGIERAAELAAEVLTAAQKKHQKYAGNVADLVLILHARRSPQVLLDVVVQELTSSLTPEFRKLGFRGVWLVGNTKDLVHQLS